MRRPSREMLTYPLYGDGVVTGCGCPRTLPEASSTRTRQRFMLPPRLLEKNRECPSGAQTGFQSVGASLVTCTAAPPDGVMVQRSRCPASPALPQYAIRYPCGDQWG